jgi:hypothetical protein
VHDLVDGGIRGRVTEQRDGLCGMLVIALNILDLAKFPDALSGQLAIAKPAMQKVRHTVAARLTILF